MPISYPLYLDVPMMVSVLAAKGGGIEPSGPLTSLGIDLEGNIGLDLEPIADNVLSQRHTLASLFDKLLGALSDDTRHVGKPKDLEKVKDGDFVSIRGPLTRNPVYEFLTVMERLFSIAATVGEEGEESMTVPDETRQVFNALNAEFVESPVVDATLTTGGGLTGVISFQKSFVSHMSLDDLRFGRVTVLGKAVGTLREGQSYSLLTRSLVGHMVSTAFRDSITGLQQVNPDEDYPVMTDVTGPGVFVVPMAVYI